MPIITPEYLDTLTTGQRRSLAQDPTFVDSCLNEGLEPTAVAGLEDSLNRVGLCVSPVVLDRVDVETGEVGELVIPCNSANSLKCPSCAEHNQRLRQRQIMNGLESLGARVLFLTDTAPSFGQVHRASWTAKDAYKARKLRGREKVANQLTVQKKRGACGCGKYHTFEDPKVGVPLNFATYDYAGEVIWSENLPNLMKSLTRKIRSLAERHGIRSKNEYGEDKDGNRILLAKSQLSLYTVYERQKRGSLHAHTIVVVDDCPEGFEALLADIKANWKSEKYNPTAQIPANRLAHYRSDILRYRWKKMAPEVQKDNEFNPEAVIPLVHWKGGKLRPGTQFGEIWDVRELEPTQDETGEITGHQQASAYLAKYLTKNQSALSPAAIRGQKAIQMKMHLTAMRQATLAIVGDRILVESLLASLTSDLDALEKRRAELEKAHLKARAKPDRYDLVNPRRRHNEGGIHFDILVPLNRVKDELKTLYELRTVLQAEVRSPLLPLLFPDDDAVSITAVRIQDVMNRRPAGKFLVSKAYDSQVLAAARGMAIRMNKALDNGGFTGALTSVSNWVTSMSDLREEMKAFATGGAVSVHEYEYSLNPERMRELARDRHIPDLVPKVPESPQDIMTRLLGASPVKKIPSV